MKQISFNFGIFQNLKKILLESQKFDPYEVNDIFDEDAAEDDRAAGSGDVEQMAAGGKSLQFTYLGEITIDLL